LVASYHHAMVRLRHGQLEKVAKTIVANERRTSSKRANTDFRVFFVAQICYGAISLICNVVVYALQNYRNQPITVYPVQFATGILLWILYTVTCFLRLKGSQAYSSIFPILLSLWSVFIFIGWVVIPARYLRNKNLNSFHSIELGLFLIMWHALGSLVNMCSIIVLTVQKVSTAKQKSGKRKQN